MFELFLLAFSTIGLANIFIAGSNFEWLRDWIAISNETLNEIENPGRFQRIKKWIMHNLKMIFSCYQCMGTWCGFICGSMIFGFVPLTILLCGFAGSFLTILANVLLNYLEAQTFVNLGKNE
jgi:hypothetical protein